MSYDHNYSKVGCRNPDCDPTEGTYYTDMWGDNTVCYIRCLDCGLQGPFAPSKEAALAVWKSITFSFQIVRR
jgi:Zn ribbon nucleic-acid-binding protein